MATNIYGARVPVGIDRIFPSPRPIPLPRNTYLFNNGSNTPVTVETTEGAEDVPTLSWEATQPTDVVTLGSLGYKVELPDNDEEGDDTFQFETFRKTHPERIMGSDGESYIDVEVIDEIGFQNRTSLIRQFLFESAQRIRNGVKTIANS